MNNTNNNNINNKIPHFMSNKIFSKNNRKNIFIRNKNRDCIRNRNINNNQSQNNLLINRLSEIVPLILADDTGYESDYDISDDIYNRLDNFIIDKYKENFDSNNENIIGRNAVVSVGSTLAATDSEEVKKINHIFLNTVKEKGVKATNQGYSGRCWIFAGLNMFRHLVIKALKLDNYEFSQTYLFFWDKLERANRYIHLFIDGVGDDDSDGDSNDNGLKEIEPGIGDINFDYYAETFLSDGGYWSMFANLVDKYGLVPSGAMPETWQSCDSEDMNNILKNIVHGCVNKIYKMKRHRNGTLRKFRNDVAKEAFRDKLLKIKHQSMQQVYNTLVKFLGQPPRTFSWNYIDDDSNTASLGSLSPHRFKDMLLTDINLAEDFVVLCNIPSEKYPYYQKYEVEGMYNVMGGVSHTMVNVPLHELKKYARKSIVSGMPVWFAGDVTKGFHPYYSSLNSKAINSDSVFGKPNKMKRSERVIFRNQVANHAMVLTGVNVMKNGKSCSWQVENSWGYWDKDTPGLDGFMYMSDEWFDEYMTEVVIHKDYFNRSRNMTRAINSEPIKVKPWSVVSQATMVRPIRRPYKYVERFLKPPSNPNSY